MPRVTQAIEQQDTANIPGSAVSVGTSSTTVVPANTSRVEVVLTNDHATQVVYLSLGGTAAASTGIRLNANGGQVKLASYTGAINAIATGAATPVLVSEV